MNQESADGLVMHVARSFDEYDRVSDAFKQDIQALAYAAYRNAFGRKMEPHLQLVTEWNVTFALFQRSLEETLVSAVFSR
jgi:hypothetical protein